MKSMASGPIISWQIDRETMKTVADFMFLGYKITVMVTAVIKLKDACSLKKSFDQLGQHIQKQTHHFANKGPYNESNGFSSSHVWMWELDYKESWVLKNWCFWTVVLEKTFEIPLDSKEIKPVNPKGNQPWILIGRTDAEVEAPILWPPDAKSLRFGKDPDAGKDWRQEEKRMTEDEMVGWHHWFNGHEFVQTLGDSEGRGNLVCCSPWGCKELDRTDRQNNNNKNELHSTGWFLRSF